MTSAKQSHEVRLLVVSHDVANLEELERKGVLNVARKFTLPFQVQNAIVAEISTSAEVVQNRSLRCDEHYFLKPDDKVDSYFVGLRKEATLQELVQAGVVIMYAEPAPDPDGMDQAAIVASESTLNKIRPMFEYCHPSNRLMFISTN